jgi:IS30 family transposase
MPKGYKHLTWEQRCQIEAYLATPLSKKEMAKGVGIPLSTLYRELAHNSNADGRYRAQAAHNKSKKRKQANLDNPKRIKGKLEQYILERLKLGWSPEQISGRLWLERKVKISKVAIYNYVRKDRENNGKLYMHLRRKGRRKRDYNKKRAGKSLIPNRTDIADREAIVDSKTRIGDWEADTVVGKAKNSGIITLVERRSKLLLMAKINNFTAEHVAETIERMLAQVHHKLHTITFDNGLEFAQHTQLTVRFPGLKTYFAEPYKSWQRGLNEHTNGLIREYFPKGTDFSTITEVDIMRVQNRLNFRPRTVLNYKCPEEVFFRAYAKT